MNTGILSLAVCEYLDFNSMGKHFYLLIHPGYTPGADHGTREGAGQDRGEPSSVQECYEVARRNFASYPKARLVRAKIPEILPSVRIPQPCYLSLDLNIVEPEIAALEFFWGKLSLGAPVILDDYGWSGFVPQKEAMDEFAARQGFRS